MKARVRLCLLAASTLTLAAATTGQAQYGYGLCEDRCNSQYQSCRIRGEDPNQCLGDYYYCIDDCSW